MVYSSHQPLKGLRVWPISPKAKLGIRSWFAVVDDIGVCVCVCVCVTCKPDREWLFSVRADCFATSDVCAWVCMCVHIRVSVMVGFALRWLWRHCLGRL